MSSAGASSKRPSASGTDLVFTVAMWMDLVAVVELVARLETRLARNRTEHRLAEKRSKRDLDCRTPTSARWGPSAE